jgi:prepilin signal peptidase PulO-like enzyme (type II secretory pathway)
MVFEIVFFVFAQKFFREIPTVDFIFLMISLFFILVLFFYDLKFLEVDRRISFPAIFLAVLWIFWKTYNGDSCSLYLIGGVVGFLFYFLQFWATKYFFKIEGVGRGDFELGALMGLLLGWKMLLGALFLAYIIGSIIGIPLLIFQKKFAKNLPQISGHLALPMGAFLMPSLLVFLYNGPQLLNWYWQFLFFGF